MNNIKIPNPFITMNSFYDQDDILQKKSEDTTQKVRFRGQPPWLANQNYMVSFVPVVMLALNVIQPSV